MDLGAVQTGIESWLNVTAVDANQAPPVPLPVEFGRQPARVQTKPFVLVYPGPIVKLGHDFPTYVYDYLTDEYVETMYGARRLTLRLSFRSFKQDWGQNARQYAEDWRIRTQKESSINALGNALLSLWGTGELVDTDYEWSGRLVSQVDTDVTLGLWAYERRASDDVGYIRTVEIEGQSIITDEYGTPLVDGTGKILVAEDVLSITVSANEAP